MEYEESRAYAPGDDMRTMDWQVMARTGEPHRTESYEWTDTVVANLEAFAAAIAGEADYPYTAEQMVHNIEVLEAVTLSAEQGETIHLGGA